MKGPTMTGNLVYPFTAILGQEKAKIALLLNAVDPNLGGVLISGPKGSGKTTLVRALGELLPDIERVKDCPFNCNPRIVMNLCPTCKARLQRNGYLPTEKSKMRIVELPLSGTEDRLLGTLDVEEALRNGEKTLLPGLLAEANQNILYIDEINLLPDYLTNSILDPAASGWCTIQREGFSLSHPAHFTLIASMNPEEGDIGPQISDRFGLSTKVDRISDIAMREEIIHRNIAYEENPTAFRKIYEKEQDALRQQLYQARQMLPRTAVSDEILAVISETCSKLRVDGFRPDLSILRAARALAAFEGKGVVGAREVLLVSELALGHRTHGGGEAPVDRQEVADSFRQVLFREIPFTGEEEQLAPLRTPTKEDLLRDISAPRRRMVKRRSWQLPSIVAYMILGGLFLILVFFVSITALVIKSMLLGMPVGGIRDALTIDQLLLTMGIVTLAYVATFLLFPSSRRRSPVFFYQTIGAGLRRHIVQVQRDGEHLSDANAEERKDKEAQRKRHDKLLNIPLYASIGRLYKLVLNRGPKLLGKEEEDRRYSFDLKRAKDRRTRGGVGRHAKTEVRSERGRYVSFEIPKKRPYDIALGPTLRAAAPHQLVRTPSTLSLNVKPEDIRTKVRESHAPLTIILLLDMSESMTTSLPKIRNAILSMHDIAYKKHDRIGLVVFKGSTATTLQSPTANLNLVVSRLKELGASDLTPLAAGMFESWRAFRNERMRNKDLVPVLVIISDGIVNVSLSSPLSPFTRSRFLNHAQADVIDASFLLHREGIQTLVINPSHTAKEDSQARIYKAEVLEKTGKRWLEPTELLMEIPLVTGGYYYGIGEGGELQSVNLSEALGIFNK